ncbi:MAG: hypothetical protein KGI71_04795 [Patescibacteria group bacterium]|nr:hypothetical protein [Patescibacteria group bacterium]
MSDDSETRTVGAGAASGDLISAAQAAAAAMSAPSACSEVCVSGTAANTAVHAFKVTWNTIGWGSDPAPAGATAANSSDPNQFAYGPLEHNGQYDVACMAAINAAGAGTIAPAACATPCGGVTPPQPPPPPPVVRKGLPKWAMWLIGLLVVGGVAAFGWWLYRRYGTSNPGAMEPRRKPRKRGRRTGKRKK